MIFDFNLNFSSFELICISEFKILMFEIRIVLLNLLIVVFQNLLKYII